MNKTAIFLALAFMALGGPLARGTAMPKFPARVDAEGTPLALRSTGIFKARVFFSVYAAALYLEEGVSSARVLEDVPKRLELHYFYSIPASVMVEEGGSALAANLSPDQRELLRERILQLNAAYRDVKPGERYALTYVPGRGTVLSLNGEEICRIDGADFAAAYFRVWLGEKPSSRALKKALLGPAG
ncbi:MAG TPA: chalcone isomerase family protein [Kiritimatiellia bacterium]|nr:chalcone isomerase family protein [Kiritimatiellia bacterium]HRZ12854.1 chalcone isomerase family protein [Kiritimatiellia bacterium]HSA18194.1 chalcone isomerase family protein [Kiritimatiellia bacterium]